MDKLQKDKNILLNNYVIYIKQMFYYDYYKNILLLINKYKYISLISIFILKNK